MVFSYYENVEEKLELGEWMSNLFWYDTMCANFQVGGEECGPYFTEIGWSIYMTLRNGRFSRYIWLPIISTSSAWTESARLYIIKLVTLVNHTVWWWMNQSLHNSFIRVGSGLLFWLHEANTSFELNKSTIFLILFLAKWVRPSYRSNYVFELELVFFFFF